MTENDNLDELLAQLATTGITSDDVEAVVTHRLRRRVEQAAEKAELWKAIDLVDVDKGHAVPERDRWGRGATLTETDIRGFYRVAAVARAHWEHVASTETSPGELAEIRSTAIRAMARREQEGNHDDNLMLLKLARRLLESPS